MHDQGFPKVKKTEDAELIAEMNEQLAAEMRSNKSYSFEDVMIDDSGIALLDATGDSYESNNGPLVATTGRYNKITYATINQANDVDWYKIEITDISKPISVVVSNIPSSCNYDVYLVQYDNTKGVTAMYQNIQSGTMAEELYGYVEEPGTYYVVVQPDISLTNNYSAANYKLYIGDYYRTGTYGWMDTGIDVSFGYIPVGNKTNSYSSWYTYNLSNTISIPDGAIVNEFYLDDSGNGAYWAGFYKALAANGQGVRLADQLGGIDLMYSGDNQYLVKQAWLIGGYLKASTYFVWEPRILITYKFPATLQNMRFL